MSDKIIPGSIEQNPSPVSASGQDRMQRRADLADQIVSTFMQMLPSNYVSQVRGPLYTHQLQAMADQLADFQLEAQEAFGDAFYATTRPEFLFQVVGALVFPDARTDGAPTITGDVPYRDFITRMVALLLKGAKASVLAEGLNLLTDANVSVVERFVSARALGAASAWGSADQHVFDVEVQAIEGTAFPADAFVLQENARIVLRALKPAHALYEYRHVLREVMQAVQGADESWTLDEWKYEDARRQWLGARRISGTSGETLLDRTLFRDATRDFNQVQPGAVLVVSSGPNSTAASVSDAGWVGRFQVSEVLSFPVGDDATARAYVTTPTGLIGTATVSGDVLEDAAQDWGLAVEGERLTMATGPNAGTYLLSIVMGNAGGNVGHVPAGQGSHRVRVAASLLRLSRRMGVAATGQAYEVDVDRLGVQEPRIVSGEDVTLQFTI